MCVITEFSWTNYSRSSYWRWKAKFKPAAPTPPPPRHAHTCYFSSFYSIRFSCTCGTLCSCEETNDYIEIQCIQFAITMVAGLSHTKSGKLYQILLRNSMMKPWWIVSINGNTNSRALFNCRLIGGEWLPFHQTTYGVATERRNTVAWLRLIKNPRALMTFQCPFFSVTLLSFALSTVLYHFYNSIQRSYVNERQLVARF